MCNSGACGPSNTLKQFSNNAWALSSACCSFCTEAKGSPLDALAQTTPTVILFTAPGFRIKGPADSTKRLSFGTLFEETSVHGAWGFPFVPQPKGSVSPGNINWQGIFGSAWLSEIWPLPP